MTDILKAFEALDRIFNYCEEIDNNIPEKERTGYNMLDDIGIIRQTLKEQSIRCEHCECWEKYWLS